MKKVLKFFSLISSIVLDASASISCVRNIDNVNDVDNNSSTSNSTQQQDQQVDFSSLTMSCLGDSITAGQGVDVSYPLLLKETLGLRQVNNYGICWSTLAYNDNCHCHPNDSYCHDPYILRFDKMANTDIISVMGGINDFSCLIPLGTIDDNTPFTYYGALNLLAKGLKDKYKNSYIFFMTNLRYVDIEHLNSSELWSNYNNAILEVCRKYDIDCFDVYNNVVFDKHKDTYDGIHPNQNFVSNVWTPQIAQFIKDNYKK